VSFLLSLTEGLLKEAKRLAREAQTSTLCHLWLRAPIISESAKDLLESLYKRSEGPRRLTARPYTLEQACQLTHIARQLAEMPASPRRTLAEALEKGVHVSLNYALYQAARARESVRQRLQHAFQELGTLLDLAPNAQGMWFWRRRNDEWRTSLLDALELVELDACSYRIPEVAHEHTA
jgi:hypothetical protein